MAPQTDEMVLETMTIGEGHLSDDARMVDFHPILLESYSDGSLPRLLSESEPREIQELRQVERRFLALLEAVAPG